MPELIHIPEPTVLFHHSQAMVDPRDGLSLFGPLQENKPNSIRWGVIGPRGSIDRMKRWVLRIQAPVTNETNPITHPLFPGFEAAFNTSWNPTPDLELEVPALELWKVAHLDDRHQRVYQTVDLFSSKILEANRVEEARVDLWCVIIPEYVYENCRPRSIIPLKHRTPTTYSLGKKDLKRWSQGQQLLPPFNDLAEQYLHEVNFHHQLKARLLEKQISIQIIRESKIAFREFKRNDGEPLYDLEKLESAIAWNLSTAIFYKAGGKPWKLDSAREGVCYIGIVFKQVDNAVDPQTACCAAQMFLDSGDGVVFKGAVGPWWTGKRGQYHLNRQAAKEIVELCITAYTTKNPEPPKELFIHGRTWFSDEEWLGFQDGGGNTTKIVGVRIRPISGFKLFRLTTHPVLRGTAYIVDSRKGFLWTKGLIPRLRTYPGREVPNPILVEVSRGDAEITNVLKDILALTKLNYNSCSFGDGLPVTLKFANAVGEILTAGPIVNQVVPPLQFRYYI